MRKFDQYVRHLQVLCRAEQEDVWLEMLRDRNDATHIYNEEAAQQLVEKIVHQYIGGLGAEPGPQSRLRRHESVESDPMD